MIPTWFQPPFDAKPSKRRLCRTEEVVWFSFSRADTAVVPNMFWPKRQDMSWPKSKQKNTWRTLWRGCPVGKAGEHLQIQILHNHLVLHPLAHQTWHLHLWRKEADEVDVSPRALPRCKRVEGKTLSLLCPGSLSLKKNNLEETQVIDFLPCHYPCAKTSDTGVSKHVIKPCHIKSHHVVWRHHDLSHHLWTPPLNPQTSKAWGRWWNWGLHSSQPWQNPQTVARHPQRLLWRRRLA